MLIVAVDELYKLCDVTEAKDGLYIRSAPILTPAFIESLPTIDAVPVVRCKDCKRYGNLSRYSGTVFNFRFCDKFGNITTDEDFCSYGERRVE